MRLVLPLALALAATFAGCMTNVSTSSGSETASPPFAHGESATAKTAFESHAWRNDAAKAQVTWGGSATSGRLEVVVKDAAGETVYTGSFGPTSQSGAQSTSTAGAPGTWKVELSYVAFTGRIGLVVASG